MFKLDYKKMEKELIEFLNNNKVMVLSTSFKDRVTSRMMSVINNGIVIYFQTSINSTKYEQMLKNQNVSLCISNMQLEGKAKIKCHPYDDIFFKENYSKTHANSFKTYSHLKEEILIEVHPTFVTFWKYDKEGNPYRDFIDIINKKAYKEYYKIND